MRISSVVILFSLFFCAVGAAQTRFGIKAGINTIDIERETIDIFDSEGRKQLKVELDKANYGINIGMFVLAKSKRFYIQPEVIYNSNSTDYKIDTLGSLGGYLDGVFREKYQNLDIPIMVGLRFDFLRLGVGPVGHVFLNSTSDLLDFNGYRQDFNNLNLGYQAGLGIDLSSIVIDLRYEGNFTNYGDHFEFFGTKVPFSNAPVRFIGTIGISF
jgi:hypothetical protein